MAKVRLRATETRKERLPEVCMACGESAESHIKKQFSWFPQWVFVLIFLGLIPYAIVAAILTKKMTVEVPVCPRHRRYFVKRVLWTILALVLCFGAPFVIGIAGAALADQQDQGTVFMAAFMAFIVLLIVAIIVIAIIQGSSIKPNEITDESITLIKVSDTFVDAMEALREERRILKRRDDYDDDPRSRRRRAEYEDDDDRPRGPSDKFRAEPPDEDYPRRRRRDED